MEPLIGTQSDAPVPWGARSESDSFGRWVVGQGFQCEVYVRHFEPCLDALSLQSDVIRSIKILPSPSTQHLTLNIQHQTLDLET
jgi:hypothetical protein